ncbi:aldo/keto reductase [Candidatus Neomarinimicrobiota bacterium]
MSEIALGGWLNLGGWLGEQASISLYHQAFAMGVNLFDVADVYTDGQSEVVLGKAMKGLPRDQIIIATKCQGRVWPGPMGEGLSRKHIMIACEASLRRLDVDYIDLYQAHAPDPDTPIEETLAAFDHLVRQGKVLYVGCSNFSADQITEAHTAADEYGFTHFISNQSRYNIVDRVVEDTLFPVSHALGVGSIVYSPLARGVLTGKYAGAQIPENSRQARLDKPMRYLTDSNLVLVERLRPIAERFDMTLAQLALRWVLRREVVSSAIIGATRPEQLDENLAAGDLNMTNDMVAAINAAIAHA